MIYFEKEIDRSIVMDCLKINMIEFYTYALASEKPNKWV